MTTPDMFDLASGPLSWLLTYSIHSTLLLGGAWLLTWRLVQSHAVRDTLWKAAIVGGLVTTSLQVGLGVEPIAGGFALATERLPSAGLREPVASARIHRPAEVSPAATTDLTPFPSLPTPPVRAAVTTSPESLGGRLAGVVFLLWAGIAGVLLLLFRTARLRLVYRLGRRRPIVNGPLPPLLEALRRAAGIRRPIRLTRAAGLASPAALGLSEICLPEPAITELDLEQQRGMLAHELAHLSRLDPLWLTLSCLIEQILFFQPLNRLARRRQQEAAEYLCDDWAVHRTGSGLTLAKCLVKVAEWIDATPRTVPIAAMAERRSQLVARIHRLVENRAMNTQPKRPWLIPFVAVLLGSTAIVAPGFTASRQAAGAEPQAMPADSTRHLGLSDRQAAMRHALRRLRTRLGHLQIPPTPRVPLPPKPPRPPEPPFASWTGGRHSVDTTGTAVPALIAALKDTDVEVRRAAAQSLGSLEDPRAVPGLIEALGDADAGVRGHAAEALGSMQDPRAREGLTGLLKDSNADVREAAVGALAELEDPKPAPFITALWDSSPGVRRQAAAALGDLHDAGAVDPLIQGLKDSDAEVRQHSARGLGALEDRRAVRPLITALADAMAEVRQAAADALGELQDPQAADGLAGALKDRDADVRQSAAHALGELRLSAAPRALLDALTDSRPDVRQSAALALGEIQDPTAVPALRAALDDQNADVRESAVSALSEIRDAAARAALVGALKSKDPNVRRQAAEALGEDQ
ncbi:MAG: HEAT repeat domain-containing protein [Gemmatimonadales bacterium]